MSVFDCRAGAGRRAAGTRCLSLVDWVGDRVAIPALALRAFFLAFGDAWLGLVGIMCPRERNHWYWGMNR